MKGFLTHWLLPRLGKLLINFLGSTLRMQHSDIPLLHDMLLGNSRAIFAFWHNRLILLPFMYRQARSKGGRFAVMVSRSRDGQIIADIIEQYRFRPVRGSTTRGGKAALREMIKALKDEGYDAAFTPDGPRGPRYEAGPGVVVLAHLTGLPIVPACFDAVPKITLKSWDRMMIPLPFARAVFRLGSPIHVGKDANANVLEEKVLEVKTALDRLSDRCALDLAR